MHCVGLCVLQCARLLPVPDILCFYLYNMRKLCFCNYVIHVRRADHNNTSYHRLVLDGACA